MHFCFKRILNFSKEKDENSLTFMCPDCGKLYFESNAGVVRMKRMVGFPILVSMIILTIFGIQKNKLNLPSIAESSIPDRASSDGPKIMTKPIDKKPLDEKPIDERQLQALFNQETENNKILSYFEGPNVMVDDIFGPEESIEKYLGKLKLLKKKKIEVVKIYWNEENFIKKLEIKETNL